VKRIRDSNRENNLLTKTVVVAKNPAIPEAGPEEPSSFKAWSNEAFPNGTFEAWDPASLKEFSIAGNAEVVERDGNHVLAFKRNMNLQWNAPDRIVQNADYVFSSRVRALNVGPDSQKMGMLLWAREPAMHEPFTPKGYIPFPAWGGTFNWKNLSTPFRMPLGATRFLLFFNDNAANGWSYLDDVSIHPADDTPLDVPESAPLFGASDREQMTWIWNRPDFPWTGNPQREYSMSNDQVKPVPRQEVWFRRTLPLPAGFEAARAVFVGDDSASLSVNGKAIGSNGSVQDIETFPLQDALHAGENEIVWKVVNAFGPGGLLGRIDWREKGAAKVFPTNGLWECSADRGATWQPAAEVAVPAPLSAVYDWCYPHLPKQSYALETEMPSGATAVRIAVRSPGSFRVLADGKEVYAALCASHTIKVDLSEELKAAKTVAVSLEDIGQPPAGAGLMKVEVDGQWKEIPFASFRHDGKAPAPLASKIFFSTKTWPTNVGSFEAAASRPFPETASRPEPWLDDLLAGSKPLFRIGTPASASSDFAPLDPAPPREVALPLADPKGCPRGLQPRLCPEVAFKFDLPEVPAQGAAFVLGVEDAEALVSQVGVFVNGILCGMPQIVGYSSVPGLRPVNRAWAVTIPPERLAKGANSLVLRWLPSYYQNGTAAQNQSQEYIQMMGLGDAAQNPYKGPWIHWNYLALHALAKAPDSPVNGRPVWMGTNCGYMPVRDLSVWKDHMVRDLSYVGLTGTDAPVRYAIFEKGQISAITKPAADGRTVGDEQLSSLVDEGMKPHLLTEPGRRTKRPADLDDTIPADFVKRYGKYGGSLEVGNEVDEPQYGWDALRLSEAYASIQRQAVCGQMLKKQYGLDSLQIVGQGWYHAWDFSVVDAQARRETPDDPGWTDALSTHNYGKSYIISATGYRLLYGTNLPKPVWTTECGSWSASIDDATEFDANIRGNLSFATYILQYLLHPYDDEMRHFSLLQDESANARILERCRSYRRLVHAYGLHGKPLPWRYADAAAMKDKLVLVNPVDAGKWIKVSFVNFSHESQPLDVSVALPFSGSVAAVRYGEGKTVAEGTRAVTLQAGPETAFKETLAPGETVEYLIRR
ncbi:MAG TPA: hypothetical protein VIM58_04900, partial [Candidatus Methylacidiphilales bacterium]